MEQQAWILRSILTQLEKQEIVDEETSESIPGEFVRLKCQSMKYRTDKNYPSKAAEKQENIKKNRYKDIVPFDHSRVKLSLATAKTDTDYINASFIKGVSGSRAYIATQGPLPHTVVDFLRMIWEHNIKIIVMACREFEMGKKKCELYWPKKEEEAFVCGPFKVHCDSEEEKEDYLTRTLRVTYRNCSRTLKQLHYVNWPDHGVPNAIPPILDLLHEMRCYQDHDDIPICIHCSAGCGRTGVLCVIDYTWNLLRNQMITSDFSIYNLVQDMRTQRPSVVQTKEQYVLVYRTIKLLFQRYLESMNPQTNQNEVTVASSALTNVMSESELSDMSEELDLMPQQQHLLDEDRHVFLQYHTPLASASENLISLRAKDMQWSQQQCPSLQSLPVALTTIPGQKNEEPNMSPQLVDTSQRVPDLKDNIQECLDTLSPNPLPAEAVCLMVEDPYFDTPMSSPSSEETPLDPVDDSKWTMSPIFTTPSLLLNDQTVELNSPGSGTEKVLTDEEMPPPIPERTPESYILAVDAELSDACERLAVIHPPNAETEAVEELAGSSPSPVPPLPERTPESFELATDPAPVEQHLEVTPAVNLDIIGMSSEWFGNSTPAATARQNDKKSKHTRAEIRFSVPVMQFDFKPNITSNHDYYSPPLEPSAPPLHQSEDSLTRPLSDKIPESFVFTTIRERSSLCPHPSETAHQSSRVGMSSEWDGTSQSKSLLDVVMRRSKSVRAKSSKQEPLAVFQPFVPVPVVAAEGGSGQVESSSVNHGPSLNTDKSRNKSDKTEKVMSRTKSLKFFKKQKPKTTPPPPPSQPGGPPQSLNASCTGFKFGFGHRFGKPKGPRSYPETWV
ncbi:tyrosine-protein phosphatase non-receptor type 22 [Melanotaenia boesemani]|uniref:tyrosine-protein phosphatase non-receptor type 22 n=1 Tax=Melanotaenia boesemani TaxID=1250792 RepID=UPI001C05D994|nr:tyrosine-protein phosphatase non-receptor type 22 [Melanotaenia boesemani]